jgi:Spy/CpxP family protein refolding chaperone
MKSLAGLLRADDKRCMRCIGRQAMKTSRRWLYWALPAVLAVGLITFGRAYASGPFCRGFHGHHGASSSAEVAEHLEHKVEYVLDAVDANDAQRKQADALVQKLAPEMFKLMGDGHALRAELKSALLAEKLDKARIEVLRTRLDTLADRLVDTGMDGVVSLAEILTPAQRQKVADRLARMHL